MMSSNLCKKLNDYLVDTIVSVRESFKRSYAGKCLLNETFNSKIVFYFEVEKVCNANLPCPIFNIKITHKKQAVELKKTFFTK